MVPAYGLPGVEKGVFANSDQCVILLHGLARTSKSMTAMADALREQNYTVVNHGYSSRSATVDILANETLPKALRACREADSQVVNLVTHSMGGILLRYYLENHGIEELGRVVMLSPPNHGSQLVDKLKHFPGFSFINGPAGMQLGTGDDAFIERLGPMPGELGIIAGTRTFNVLLSQLLPNPDDGKVSVASTKLESMCSFTTMPVTHTFMMKNSKVIAQVIEYLKSGRFTSSAAQNNLCSVDT